jgi:BRCT domain type II-containing protein
LVRKANTPMSISRHFFVAALFVWPAMGCTAQSTTAATTGGTTGSSANYFTPTAPSDILQRSLDEVRITVGNVRLDKWKRGSVRDEAGVNIEAIQRDLQGALPPLLKDADAAPGTLTKVLPLSRNVDALYDVMVHVVEAARVVASGETVGQLQQAMTDLEKARVVLDNQIQQTADMQEKQVLDLRNTVQKQEVSLRAAATPPPAAKCPVPVPAKKKRRATKPSSSTTNSKSAAGTPSTQSKPQ